MNPSECSLSILAGPADAPFLREIVRHLDRVQHGHYGTRTLILDTLPPARVTSRASVDQLMATARTLVSDGAIDRVIELEPRGPARDAVDTEHFGRPLKWDRDFRGVPLRGWIAGLVASTARYHAHFDSDILLHQMAGYCWVNEGIRLLESAPELLTIAPYPGPPRVDRTIDQTDRYAIDDRGYFRFETFSSRRFLTDRARFMTVLPLRPAVASRRHRLRSWLGLGSPILNWELMVRDGMRRHGLFRGHLTAPQAWSLHAPDHGLQFLDLLPAIIQRVEAGDFPEQQAGRYDLDLKCWATAGRGTSANAAGDPVRRDV